MKRMTSWDHWEDDPQLVELHKALEETLVPVSPRSGFVQGLRSRLLAPQEAEKSHLTDLAILSVVGIASSVLVVILGVKAGMALLGMLGLLNQMKQQAQKDQNSSPFQSAYRKAG